MWKILFSPQSALKSGPFFFFFRCHPETDTSPYNSAWNYDDSCFFVLCYSLWACLKQIVACFICFLSNGLQKVYWKKKVLWFLPNLQLKWIDQNENLYKAPSSVRNYCLASKLIYMFKAIQLAATSVWSEPIIFCFL